MKPAILILRPDDAGALARIHATGFDHPWSAAAMRDLLKQPNVLALGIEQETSLAAFLLVRMTADTGDILTLATDPDNRRKGLARQLIGAMLVRLGERGIARLTLDVAADNDAARALYGGLGFSQDGVRRNYYRRSGDTGMDAILMSRPVAGQARL